MVINTNIVILKVRIIINIHIWINQKLLGNMHIAHNHQLK